MGGHTPLVAPLMCVILIGAACGSTATPLTTAVPVTAAEHSTTPLQAGAVPSPVPALTASPEVSGPASPVRPTIASSAVATTLEPTAIASPATTPGPPTPSSVPTKTAPLTLAPTVAASPSATPQRFGRATIDRADDLVGSQIHFMYVLPNDGVDEALDTNGRIRDSISAMQAWLGLQTGGRILRVDTFGGSPDITFVRLSATDSSIAASGAYVRDRIESDLRAAGFNAPGKIYAVYYGGGSTYACGGGAWPPSLPGIVAAMYLKGTPPGAIPCADNPIGSHPFVPGYQEFAMLHEVVHTMGFVAACAPHHTLAGHSSDDPRDLMYAGPLVWRPSLLDLGRDDYYGHAVAGCPDLARSGYLTG